MKPRTQMLIMLWVSLACCMPSLSWSAPSGRGGRAEPGKVDKALERRAPSEHKQDSEQSSTGSKERFRLSASDAKALVGQIRLQDEQNAAALLGTNLWHADVWPRRKMGRDQYEAFLAQIVREEWPGSFISEIAKEAGSKAALIFVGVANGGSIVIHPSQLDTNYTFVRPAQVARATLYLPYIASPFGIRESSGPMVKGEAPLVALSEDLFIGQEGGSTYHYEHLIDPRVDLRSFQVEDRKLVRLKGLESRQLEFGPRDVEPATIAKLGLGCCVYVRPPAYNAGLVKLLKRTRFSSSQLRVALMIHDSATRAYMAGDLLLSGKGKAESIDRSETDIEGWLSSQLRKARGGTLLLLGHVEGGDYVVRKPSGEEVGRITVNRANVLALENKVQLLHLGCKTAAALSALDAIGVYDTFNSVHMLRSISATLHSEPKNMADFLERLATPEAWIVVPASLAKNIAPTDRHEEIRRPQLADIRTAPTKLVRVARPAIHPIVSPSSAVEDLPISLTVFLTSSRANQRGNHPVVAELRVMMDPCAVLSAAKSLRWSEADGQTCKDFQSRPFSPITTQIYGHPERELR